MNHWFFFSSPSVTETLWWWRGKIFILHIIYYYQVKTLSHSWFSLNSKTLQMSGRIFTCHWKRFTSTGHDDVTAAFWKCFWVSSSSSYINCLSNNLLLIAAPCDVAAGGSADPAWCCLPAIFRVSCYQINDQFNSPTDLDYFVSMSIKSIWSYTHSCLLCL